MTAFLFGIDRPARGSLPTDRGKRLTKETGKTADRGWKAKKKAGRLEVEKVAQGRPALGMSRPHEPGDALFTLLSGFAPRGP